MNEKIEVGDVVKLKTGGPKMTVSNIGPNPVTTSVYCVWFQGDEHEGWGSLEGAWFSEGILVKIDG
jgi:uncharacterized protein YodC (DUF2158 family)